MKYYIRQIIHTIDIKRNMIKRYKLLNKFLISLAVLPQSAPRWQLCTQVCHAHIPVAVSAQGIDP